MKDIFYNQQHQIGSDKWLMYLNEAELSEWNWIQNNIDEVKKRADEFDVKEYYYLGRIMYALSFKGFKDEYSQEDYGLPPKSCTKC